MIVISSLAERSATWKPPSNAAWWWSATTAARPRQATRVVARHAGQLRSGAPRDAPSDRARPRAARLRNGGRHDDEPQRQDRRVPRRAEEAGLRAEAARARRRRGERIRRFDDRGSRPRRSRAAAPRRSRAPDRHRRGQRPDGARPDGRPARVRTGVPEDVSVVGMDGIYLAALCEPRADDRATAGARDGRAMVERAMRPNAEHMPASEQACSRPSTLVERESVAAPPPRRTRRKPERRGKDSP